MDMYIAVFVIVRFIIKVRLESSVSNGRAFSVTSNNQMSLLKIRSTQDLLGSRHYRRDPMHFLNITKHYSEDYIIDLVNMNVSKIRYL